jgi:NAD(P)-dependent dehydrogenase (short-subunit alcohol dehydrogenase family)
MAAVRSIKESIMSTQVVLFTGGLTGIGRAAAVAFAKTGAKVVVAGRRDEAGSARSRTRPRKATPRRSTPMFSA